MYPLSIITINLNNRAGLEKTMESVVNQTFRDFEYIVIDGASTDGSVDVIQRYADNIHYWVSEPDTGIYSAMNKGIRVAQGEYLLFLNSGDWLEGLDIIDQSFSDCISVGSDSDIIYFNIKTHSLTNEIVYKEYPHKLTFNFFYNRNLPHPGTFIKKILFEKNGYYDENLKICSDWKFFILNICLYQASYRHFDLIMSNFLLGGVSGSAQSKEIIKKEKEEVYVKYFYLFYDNVIRLNKLEKLIFFYENSKWFLFCRLMNKLFKNKHIKVF